MVMVRVEQQVRLFEGLFVNTADAPNFLLIEFQLQGPGGRRDQSPSEAQMAESVNDVSY